MFGKGQRINNVAAFGHSKVFELSEKGFPWIGEYQITTDEVDETYPPRLPIVEGLIHCGTYIFAGSPKIGKSFFMLQLGYHVSTGKELWDYTVRQGTVLYLTIQAKKDVKSIIEDAHVQGEYIIEMYEKKAGDRAEFMVMKKALGIVSAEELQQTRDMLKQAHQEALPFMDDAERQVFRDPFNMSEYNLEMAHENRKHMMYGCGDDLPKELCAFVKLKDVAYEYYELEKKPKNVEELYEQVNRAEIKKEKCNKLNYYY